MDLRFDPPFFLNYIQPYGYLDSNRESHALWYYYVTARGAWERIVNDPMFFEGDRDGEANFKQLFQSVARMYGVEPEAMGKCWDLVDAQCDLLDLPRMPDEDRYRFTSRIITIDTRKPN